MNVMARTHVGDSVSPVLSLRYTPASAPGGSICNVTNPDPANGITLKGPTGDVTLSCQPDGSLETRPLGAAGEFEVSRSTAPAT